MERSGVKKTLWDYVERPSFGWQFTYLANILAVLKMAQELQHVDWTLIFIIYGAGFVLTVVGAGIKKARAESGNKEHPVQSAVKCA